MHNWPNITPFEVAVVCTAALLLCIMPNLLAVADVRRRRRQQRAAAAAEVMQRRALEVGESATFGQRMAAPEVAPVDLAMEAAVVPAEGVVVVESVSGQVPTTPTPLPAEEPPLTSSVEAVHSEIVAPQPAEVAKKAAMLAWPESTEPIVCTLRLEDLRRVKLPNWPPAEVRDNAERKRLWEEAARVAEQPLLTAMAVDSPCRVESACLGSAESDGSVLRLHFFLFADLWPVAAEQATAEALFEIDSASGNVRAQVRSLRAALWR